jgi:hypothetical protein
MTKAEARKARADLRRKVRALMKNITEFALKRIDAVDEAAHIVEHHHYNSMNYATPKDYICALADELKSARSYGRARATRNDKTRILNYFIHL